MRWISLLIFITVAFAQHAFPQTPPLRGGVLSADVNSAEEDYAPYIVYGNAEDTLYFTTSRTIAGRPMRVHTAEVMFCTRASSVRQLNAPNEGWSAAKQIAFRDSSFALYTHGSIAVTPDSQCAIFAGEHVLVQDGNTHVTGSSFNLQLWQLRRDASGAWGGQEELAALLDTTSWNSQPAISSDGRTLYFVSNRAGGAGGLDIWYSRHDANAGWSKPRPVEGINTPGDDVAPHCGTDGAFYFSSTWNVATKSIGTSGKDIYRCDFHVVDGVLLPSDPVNLDSAIRRDARALGQTVPDDFHVNSPGNDEFAFIGRGREAIYFSSDRAGGMGKRDLYAQELPRPRIFLYVSVRERTVDSAKHEIVLPHFKPGFPVSLIDSATGKVRVVRAGEKCELDPDRTFYLSIDATVQDECYNSSVEGAERQMVRTVRPFLHDTTHLRSFLITRRPVAIPPIMFYSTDTLPYFITGYWWPNTTRNLKEYRKREAAGFFDRSGFVDSSGHDYALIALRIDSAFEASVYAPLKRMLTQFSGVCGDTMYLKVTIHGYTDPRLLSTGTEHHYRKVIQPGRTYPDSTVTVGIDANGKPVRIVRGADMWQHQWPVDTSNARGPLINLPDSGQQGNILLSKLRAYYTFATFDRDMREMSEQYRLLSQANRIVVDAEGFGIDKEGFAVRHERDDPRSRRIEIYLDVMHKEELKKFTRGRDGEVVK